MSEFRCCEAEIENSPETEQSDSGLRSGLLRGAIRIRVKPAEVMMNRGSFSSAAAPFVIA